MAFEWTQIGHGFIFIFSFALPVPLVRLCAVVPGGLAGL